MPVNSRQKGKRGERLAVTYLKSLGFTAERTQQHCGRNGTSDVRVSELPRLHIEVKGGDNPTKPLDLDSDRLLSAVDQAERDANGQPWCVLWKPDRKAWRLTFAGWDGVPFTVCGNVDIAVTLRRLNGYGT